MTQESHQPSEHRVLICAPHGRDAQLIASILSDHGICGQSRPKLDELCFELKLGVAAVILTEEALYDSIKSINLAMRTQPAWSDLPIIVLTTGGSRSADSTWALIHRLEPIGNVSLLERPLRSMTLVSAVQVALRSRERQYEVRSLHDDLERRVAERTAELKRLNEEAEGFSYTIAHDLRSPLRAIISTSRILLDDYGKELSQTATLELRRQASAAARMGNLIDDLLHLARLSREQMRPYPFDLTAVAEAVAAELAREESGRPCHFDIQTGMSAYGDPLLIRFALFNLMHNACKFSPQGGVVSVGKDDDVFFVKDEGIGFGQEYAEKIFHPFERLVDQSEFPGTGIGLANVKRIIERHRGRVWAESEPGKGGRFYFCLPSP